MRKKKLGREQAIAWVLYFTEGYAANVETHIKKFGGVLDRTTLTILRKAQHQAKDTADDLRERLRIKG